MKAQLEHDVALAAGARRRTVLVVDADARAREAAGKILRGAGYELFTAEDFDTALALLESADIDLVVTDMSISGRSGWDLIEHVHGSKPGVATIMLTATDDQALATRAHEVGAYGFIVKPFRRSELLMAAAVALRRRQLEIENRDYRERLEDRVRARTSELLTALKAVESSAEELRVSREDTIECLSVAAEFNDNGSAAHVKRMSRYCGLLARWVGLHPDHCDMIRTTSIMHDVGKIGIPDSILLKPAPLTLSEYEVMQGHAELGYRILSGPRSDLLELAASIALTHHERYNGAGYPQGLKADEIPLEGRIAAVADVFDALTTVRVYRDAYDLSDAIGILKEGRGEHFDPDLLNLFLAHLDEVLMAKQEEEAAAATSVALVHLALEGKPVPQAEESETH